MKKKKPRVTLVRVNKVQAGILQRAGVQTFTSKDLVPVNPLPVPSGEVPMSTPFTPPLVKPSKLAEPTALEKARQRTMERLSQAEYYKLYKWLERRFEANDADSFQPGVTPFYVAELATAALGFKVTEWVIRGALETCGFTLPVAKQQLTTEQKVAKLTMIVNDLIDGLLLYGQLPEATHGPLAGLRDECKELM